MHNIDDVTLLHDSDTGVIVFIVPKPIIFDDVEEFSQFIDLLKTQLDFHSGMPKSTSSIDSDYAQGAIDDWTNQLNPFQEGSETHGHKTQETEP